MSAFRKVVDELSIYLEHEYPSTLQLLGKSGDTCITSVSATLRSNPLCCLSLCLGLPVQVRVVER